MAGGGGPDLRPGEEKRARRKLVRVSQVMRLGTEAALKIALQGLGLSGRLNTACIERVNLTVRHGIAALARRTWAAAQQSPHLMAHLEWWRAYYHFVRPPMHRSEWRSCSHENEVASWWRNASGSVRKLWQREEPTGAELQGKCCAILHNVSVNEVTRRP